MLHILLLGSALCLTALVFLASTYITGFALFGAACRQPPSRLSANSQFIVFVPAHNEGAGIIPTLRSIQQAAYPQDRIRVIVIADNCTDDTADQARGCGAETWIRNEAQLRGKGHALQWAFARIDSAFDLLTVVDADTQLDPAFFAEMDSVYAASLAAGRPELVLQGRYVFDDRDSSTWFERFSVATKAAENSFCFRPRTLLGLANVIHGNGFCVSRAAIGRVPFRASSIVEDVEYAITLALNRVRVAHVDRAVVTSRMARRLNDAATQRLRWASGTFDLLLRTVPTLLRESLRRRDWRLAEMALMLVLSSRLLLVYATAVSIALLLPLRFSSSFGPLVLLLGASLILQFVYIYFIFRKAGGEPVPFQTLAFMPLYFGFLGAMQLGAALGLRKNQWNRTTR